VAFPSVDPLSPGQFLLDQVLEIMTHTISISCKALGRKKPLFADFSIPAPPLIGEITLRMLLEHVVRQEVAAFQARQADRRLLQALSATQIEEGLAQGKVSTGGSTLDQKVDVEQAVATVIEAFQDGLFLVVLDEAEVKELDTKVTLTESSRLTFVRLALLAGG
jgi:hypothetical protein